MATFSENQVRQLYVATALKQETPNKASTHLAPSDAFGTIDVFPGDVAGDQIYLEYKSDDASGVVRSDLINSLDIVSVKNTLAEDMATHLKQATIALTGAVEDGVEYIAKVRIVNYVGMSDEDTVSLYGMVKATAAMAGDADDPVSGDPAKNDKFLKALAESLALNSSKVVVPLVDVFVHSAATSGASGFDASGLMKIIPGKKMNYQSVVDIDSIVVREHEQPWTLGKFSQDPVIFKVQIVPAGKDGEETADWATVTYADSTVTISNGRKIADLEYFCKGERGDIYRGMGYPNNFKYYGIANKAVEEDPTTAYDVIDIVYNYVGNNEDSQKSRKVISIAAPHAVANLLVARIEVSAGLIDAPAK